MKMAELRVKSRTGLVQNSAKLLLKNVIRHTDTHNRLVEEAQMWQLYQKMKGNNAPDEDSRFASRGKRQEDRDKGGGQHTFRDPDVKNSFLYDDRQVVTGASSSGKWCRAHMDFDDNNTRDRTSGLSAGGSTYWMRQLEKAEAADGERWGHAGYKELYPQDFQSDRSSASDKEDSDSDSNRSSRPTGDERRRRRRSKKSKLDISEKKDLKRDKKRKKRLKKRSTDEFEKYEKKKRSKRKRRREEEDSDSDDRQTKRSKKRRSGSDRKKKRK